MNQKKRPSSTKTPEIFSQRRSRPALNPGNTAGSPTRGRSLARPGGNITGVFLDLPELSGKQLELLKEVAPQLSRVAILGDPVLNAPQFAATEVAARAFAIQPQSLEVRVSADFETALEAARRGGAEAVILLSSPLVFSHRAEIGALGLSKRLPVVSLFGEVAEAGGLVAYGPSLRESFQRCGGYVEKILRGAKPGYGEDGSPTEREPGERVVPIQE